MDAAGELKADWLCDSSEERRRVGELLSEGEDATRRGERGRDEGPPQESGNVDPPCELVLATG